MAEYRVTLTHEFVVVAERTFDALSAARHTVQGKDDPRVVVCTKTTESAVRIEEDGS
jgi:hypothetical protein